MARVTKENCFCCYGQLGQQTKTKAQAVAKVPKAPRFFPLTNVFVDTWCTAGDVGSNLHWRAHSTLFLKYVNILCFIFSLGEIGASNGGNVLLRSFTISEDFRNMDATIEVHLTSIDLLLSVKVDSRNRINSVSTIYTTGKTETQKVSISSMKGFK